MDFPNWVQSLPFCWFLPLILAWFCFRLLLEDLDLLFPHSSTLRPKTANLLFLGRNEYRKRSVIWDLSDERIPVIQTPPYSRLSIIGRIKFNLYDFGELRTACRVWKDYCAKRDAVVYVVDADTSKEQLLEAKGELNDLLSDEDFANVPFLIFCETQEPSPPSGKELCSLLGLIDKTTGKARVELLAGTNARPLEVFVAKPSNRMQHQDAIWWLSRYIN